MIFRYCSKLVKFLAVFSPPHWFCILSSTRSHYELLGVSTSVDGITLRSAFRRLSKELHPDTTSLPVDEAAWKFQQVCEAYELLSDPIRRRVYDDSLAAIHSASTSNSDGSLLGRKNSFFQARTREVRRPLSVGELFSLVLLIGTILIGSILAIIFAFSQGREFQSRPSWLIASISVDEVISQKPKNDSSFFDPMIAPSKAFDFKLTLTD